VLQGRKVNAAKLQPAMTQHLPDRALKHREIWQPNLFRVCSRFCTPAIATAASGERQNRQDNHIVFIRCICTDPVSIPVGAVFVSACTHCID